jgi:hypothetical protein
MRGKGGREEKNLPEAPFALVNQYRETSYSNDQIELPKKTTIF